MKLQQQQQKSWLDQQVFEKKMTAEMDKEMIEAETVQAKEMLIVRGGILQCQFILYSYTHNAMNTIYEEDRYDWGLNRD